MNIHGLFLLFNKYK
ncbi:hypothetical protein ECPA23_5134, partial [Escherichia coli PA23]